MGSIDFMLRKIDEGLAAVTEHYAEVKDADSLPDDLLYAIRNLDPDIAAAFERHQPYRAVNEALGHLHELSRCQRSALLLRVVPAA